MSSMSRIAAVALAFAAAGAAAGQVDVSFHDPDRFIDAGDLVRDRDDNLKVLADYLQLLGRRSLPQGQSLKIEVLDVDLAGRQSLNSRYNFRVLHGGADWPRIRLRYALAEDGKVVREAEETVSDLDYLMAGPGLVPRDPLRYEKHMLQEWFDNRFAESKSASR